MGLGHCGGFESIAIIWLGCGCWFAFDWRYEFTFIRFTLCVLCLALGIVRASFTEHATNYTKPIISEKYSLFIDDLIEDVDQPAKGIIRWICNGDKSGISKSTKTLITSAGLAHVLAFN